VRVCARARACARASEFVCAIEKASEGEGEGEGRIRGGQGAGRDRRRGRGRGKKGGRDGREEGDKQGEEGRGSGGGRGREGRWRQGGRLGASEREDEEKAREVGRVSEMGRAESGCVKEREGEGRKADSRTGREVGSEGEGGNGREGVRERGGWGDGEREERKREVNGIRQSERASERARGRKREGREREEREVNTLSDSEYMRVCGVVCVREREKECRRVPAHLCPSSSPCFHRSWQALPHRVSLHFLFAGAQGGEEGGSGVFVCARVRACLCLCVREKETDGWADQHLYRH
jgi:hypothetical protein